MVYFLLFQNELSVQFELCILSRLINKAFLKFCKYPSYPLEPPLLELLGILFFLNTLYMTFVDVDSSWTSCFFCHLRICPNWFQ